LIYANRLRTISFILILIFILNSAAVSVSHKRHNAIIRKASANYKKLENNKKWSITGGTNRGNEIMMRVFGSGPKTVLIIGGIHGDEPASVIAVIRLAKHLEKNPGLTKNRAVLIPCLNPDGLRIGTRTNGNKIDINRNYPSSTWSSEYIKDYNNPGPEASSEPETLTVIDAINTYHPVLVVQMHQPFGALYPDKNTPSGLVNKMSEISGFPVLEDIGYSTPGSLGNYLGEHRNKIMCITYELGPVDREPDYDKITGSLIEAINFH
jgi:protein MpaA